MSGGADPLNQRRRIERLEAELAALRARLETVSGRAAQVRPPRQVRWVKTGTSSNYPAAGNAFEITFLDPSFDPEPGQQTVDRTPRAPLPQNVGATMDGRYLPIDSEVLGIELNGRWVLVDPQQTRRYFQGASNNTTSGVTGEVEIDMFGGFPGFLVTHLSGGGSLPNSHWGIVSMGTLQVQLPGIYEIHFGALCITHGNPPGVGAAAMRLLLAGGGGPFTEIVGSRLKFPWSTSQASNHKSVFVTIPDRFYQIRVVGSAVSTVDFRECHLSAKLIG